MLEVCELYGSLLEIRTSNAALAETVVAKKQANTTHISYKNCLAPYCDPWVRCAARSNEHFRVLVSESKCAYMYVPVFGRSRGIGR